MSSDIARDDGLLLVVCLGMCAIDSNYNKKNGLLPWNDGRR